MALPDPLPVAPPPVTPPPDSSLAGRPSPPEPTPSRAPVLTDDAAHQLPAHRGKVGRVTDHVKGAADSLTDWFELRIALLKREVKDEIQTFKEQAATLGKAYGLVAVLGLAAALVALLMLGFLFSALWGLLLGDEAELWSLTFGFFTLMALLGLGALVALRRAKRAQNTLSLFASEDSPRATTDGAALPAPNTSR